MKLFILFLLCLGMKLVYAHDQNQDKSKLFVELDKWSPHDQLQLVPEKDMQILLLPLGRIPGGDSDSDQTSLGYSSGSSNSASSSDIQKITQSAAALIDSAQGVEWNGELPILIGKIVGNSLYDNQKQIEMYIMNKSSLPNKKRKCIPKRAQQSQTMRQHFQSKPSDANQGWSVNHLQQQQRNIPVYSSRYDLDVVRKLYSRHRNWFIL